MAEPAEPDTRSKILVAASTMLGEDPTGRLTVRAVAARAGVSVGSLRHFFPTQQLLLDTVVAGLQSLDLPDDPMADGSGSPAERLEACLQLLLTSAGTGASAREYWSAVHRAYLATPVAEDAAQAFLALERVALHRIERWLDALRDGGATLARDTGTAAQFLLTVVNGLSLERALPGAQLRTDSEARSLRLAVDAVLLDVDVHA